MTGRPSDLRIVRVDERIDPRVAIAITLGLCPECHAIARPADPELLRSLGITPRVGWLDLVHAPNCTVADASLGGTP